MAAFDPSDARDRGNVAYLLCARSFVSMFHRTRVLTDTMAWLRRNDYRLWEVSAHAWDERSDAVQKLHQVFDLEPDTPKNKLGMCRTWQAMSEALGQSEDTHVGGVLVLRECGDFVRSHPSTAHAMLDTFAQHARLGALIGQRMMCLIEVDDPTIQLAPVGQTAVAWAPGESDGEAGHDESDEDHPIAHYQYVSWI